MLSIVTGSGPSFQIVTSYRKVASGSTRTVLTRPDCSNASTYRLDDSTRGSRTGKPELPRVRGSTFATHERPATRAMPRNTDNATATLRGHRRRLVPVPTG